MKIRRILSFFLLFLLLASLLLTGCSRKEKDALQAQLVGDWLLLDEKGSCKGVLSLSAEGSFCLEEQTSGSPYCTGTTETGSYRILPDLAVLFQNASGAGFHGWVDTPGVLTLNDDRVLKKGTRPDDFVSPTVSGCWAAEDGSLLLQVEKGAYTLTEPQREGSEKRGTLLAGKGGRITLNGGYTAMGRLTEDGSYLTLNGMNVRFFNPDFPPAPKDSSLLSSLTGDWLYFDGGAILHFSADGSFLWQNTEAGTEETGRFRITKNGILCVLKDTVYPAALGSDGKLNFGPYEGYFYFDDHRA